MKVRSLLLLLSEGKTPSEKFNVPVIGKIIVNPRAIKMKDENGEEKEIKFPGDEYEVIGITDTAYVCNKWYKEHKDIPQLIPKDMVDKFVSEIYYDKTLKDITEPEYDFNQLY